MKKITVALSLLLLSVMPNFHALQAYEISLEFRGGGFFPTDRLFRDIYGSASGSYGGEIGIMNNKWFNPWLNFDWFSKDGESIGLNDHTRVQIANWSFGLRFPYEITSNLISYVGIGPSISWIRIKNDTHCGDDRASKGVAGGILKTGVYYFFARNFFIDLFVDLLYQPAHFQDDVDIGAAKVGGGVGVKF